MDFKKGAFANGCPLKIYACQFVKNDFNICLNLLNELQSILMGMANPRTHLIMHEFDNYNPKYRIDKSGLRPGAEENWTHFAADVNYLMEYACGLPQGHNGMSEKMEMESRHK